MWEVSSKERVDSELVLREQELEGKELKVIITMVTRLCPVYPT